MRLVLVGLGVDERAKRIVNLLVRSGMDIQLLTFQAFRQGAQVLLARQVETVEPKPRGGSGGGGTKQDNRRLLEELAAEQDVLGLLIEVADFVEERMPAYRWPHKTAFTYSLNDVTEAGRPTQRSYATVRIDQKKKGQVILSLPERAIEAGGDVVQAVVDSLPRARLTSSSWTPFELPITEDSWPSVRSHVEEVVNAVVAGWEERMAALGDEPA